MHVGVYSEGLRMHRRAQFLFVLTVFATVAFAACRRGEYEKPCGQLPEQTACPKAGGGTCADKTCSAVYSCRDGTWSLDESCNRTDGGIEAGLDAAKDSPFPTCGDAGLDPDAGDPSMCPPLSAPDCDFAVAKSCPEQACLGDCIDYLRCTKTGWSDGVAAYCDEEGMLVVVK